MGKYTRTKSLALLFTGLLFLLGGLAFYVEAQVFKMNAVVTSGKITRLIENRDSKGNLRYSPVFVFADQNGVQHEITSSHSSSPAIGDVGS